MAKKIDTSAADKAKKQKIILGIAGILLVGLAAMQGPKLWKQLNPPAPAAAPAATSAPTATTAPAATPTGTTSTTAPVSGNGPRALLAGIAIRSAGMPAADEGQLRSFSLFEPKDPFVQQQTDQASTPAASPTPAPGAGKQAGGTGAGLAPAAVPGVPGAPAGGAPAEPALTNATIVVNGSSQALALKDKFPRSDPLFVLVSLKKQVARIGVAGGSFADGKTLPLQLDRQVTLVNDATGARYAIKLVYVGTAPEKVATFSQPAPAAPATTTTQK